MTKQCVNVDALPKAGPYSHAVVCGGFVFVSGNVPIDPKTGDPIKGDIGKATRAILKNIETILKEAGSDITKVVKTTIFLTEMSAFGEVNAVYGEVFKENPPARSTVGVRELPGGFEIEIEAIARV